MCTGISHCLGCYCPVTCSLRWVSIPHWLLTCSALSLCHLTKWLATWWGAWARAPGVSLTPPFAEPPPPQLNLWVTHTRSVSHKSPNPSSYFHLHAVTSVQTLSTTVLTKTARWPCIPILWPVRSFKKKSCNISVLEALWLVSTLHSD